MPKIKVAYNRSKETKTFYWYNPIAISILTVIIDTLAIICVLIYQAKIYGPLIFVFSKISTWFLISLFIWIFSLPLFSVVSALADLANNQRVDYTKHTFSNNLKTLIATNFIYSLIIWILVGFAYILATYQDTIKGCIILIVVIVLFVLALRSN